MKLPSFLASCFWSYNLNSLDKIRDRNLIITQVLNYGNQKQTEWMKKNYSAEEIKKVINHPRRGLWFRDKLRQWLNYFDLMIDPLEFESGIRHLRPWPSLYAAFFARKGL